MPSPAELLLDGYGRLPELVRDAVDGLSAGQLAARLDPEANSIAWLVWHLARVEDVSVAQAFDADQVWTTQDWARRFGLPFPDDDMGYGHTSEQVAAVQVDSPRLLTDYYEAVAARTREHLGLLTGDDLDRVVDRDFDPPVTLGVRLVSVLEDAAQHVGQASFVRGVLQRRGG